MKRSSRSALMIVLYLVAIVAANLLVAAFGPNVAVVNAFLFIGLDITARDSLHEAWQHEGLWWKMLLLIATGSILSAALNWNAAQIALASFLAFAGAGIADTLVYHALRDRARMLKINGSNVISAAVDSALFPALAFGFPLLIGVMIGQFIAKVVGGFVWSVILHSLEIRGETRPAL
ncbi:MAG: VUT family protein [Anaerolineae bacterium]|nr:VUT family protein [Anaerolineae bacterium]